MPSVQVERSLTSRIRVFKFNIFFNTEKQPGDELEKNERVADKCIDDKVLEVTFRRQLLLWLLRGSYRYYQERRIKWSASIEQDTRAFWRDVDYFEHFLTEKCEIAEALLPLEEAIQRKLYTPSSAIYSKFRDYVRAQANISSTNMMGKTTLVNRLEALPSRRSTNVALYF
ncbi:uncharacterized protein VTP21DRAFT_10606 [Calcarisporiella thermophila]|uniref:uncharacterized protein n=1 Tax=Calcarisporiella thermophila TaxID=911321 RepID=UPI003743B128